MWSILTLHFSVRVLSRKLSAFFNASITLGRSTKLGYNKLKQMKQKLTHVLTNTANSTAASEKNVSWMRHSSDILLAIFAIFTTKISKNKIRYRIHKTSMRKTDISFHIENVCTIQNESKTFSHKKNLLVDVS